MTGATVSSTSLASRRVTVSAGAAFCGRRIVSFGALVDSGDAVGGAFPQADQHHRHRHRGEEQDPEQNALIAGNHGCCFQSVRHAMIAAVRASIMRC